MIPTLYLVLTMHSGTIIRQPMPSIEKCRIERARALNSVKGPDEVKTAECVNSLQRKD